MYQKLKEAADSVRAQQNTYETSSVFEQKSILN